MTVEKPPRSGPAPKSKCAFTLDVSVNGTVSTPARSPARKMSTWPGSTSWERDTLCLFLWKQPANALVRLHMAVEHAIAKKTSIETLPINDGVFILSPHNLTLNRS